MPYNPQTKIQSNICQQILAKFVKNEELSQNSIESQESGQNMEIAEGKWEDDQNLKFIVFIDYHSKIFSSKQRRKSQKIFKTLSKHLGNRTPAQCRSHYQKVMIKFKTIAKLKKHFKEYFEEQKYNEAYKEFVESWKQEHPQDSQQKPQRESKQLIETGVQTEPMAGLDQSMQQMMMFWQMQQWTAPFFSCPYDIWSQEKITQE